MIKTRIRFIVYSHCCNVATHTAKVGVLDRFGLNVGDTLMQFCPECKEQTAHVVDKITTVRKARR